MMKAIQVGVRVRPEMVPVVAVVLVSWALTVMMMVGGDDGTMAHDAVMDVGHGPRPATIVLFLVAWQVTTGAKMVPSSLPMVRLFAGASRGQAHPWLAKVAFLAANIVL